jgi:triosephosphate isomerase
MRNLIAGNWKMHGLSAQLEEIASVCAVAAVMSSNTDILICVPATLIGRAAETAAGRISIGGEDCDAHVEGPYTGDVSARMLKDAGASAVIVGHSERRRIHGDSDGLVAAKALAAWSADLFAIVCVGETEEQRHGGGALKVVGEQIKRSAPDNMTSLNSAIGYEPLWAIGSGQMPSSDEIAEMHGHIRECLNTSLGAEGERVRILYGGSVKPDNATGIFAIPEVGGVLVGGASLHAKDFVAICQAL